MSRTKPSTKFWGALVGGVVKLFLGVWLVMIGLDWANDYWPLPEIGFWGVLCILLGLNAFVGLLCSTALTARIVTLRDSY